MSLDSNSMDKIEFTVSLWRRNARRLSSWESFPSVESNPSAAVQLGVVRCQGGSSVEMWANRIVVNQAGFTVEVPFAAIAMVTLPGSKDQSKDAPLVIETDQGKSVVLSIPWRGTVNDAFALGGLISRIAQVWRHTSPEESDRM